MPFMSQAIVGKWGKNLAVRIPSEIAKAMHLFDGARVELETREGEILLRPLKSPSSIEAIFHGKDPTEWRKLYAEAFEWGPDLGREAVEE
jgi:antitoxin MazE